MYLARSLWSESFFISYFYLWDFGGLFFFTAVEFCLDFIMGFVTRGCRRRRPDRFESDCCFYVHVQCFGFDTVPDAPFPSLHRHISYAHAQPAARHERTSEHLPGLPLLHRDVSFFSLRASFSLPLLPLILPCLRLTIACTMYPINTQSSIWYVLVRSTYVFFLYDRKMFK